MSDDPKPLPEDVSGDADLIYRTARLIHGNASIQEAEETVTMIRAAAKAERDTYWGERFELERGDSAAAEANMKERIDRLVKELNEVNHKCHEWHRAYVELKKKYETSH